MASSSTGDMITRRTMPWSIYAVLLVAIEILGFYASACFLYDDVSIQNFSEYMIRGCTENFFLPWRIANRMTPECMGIALMGWIFLVSYMMYHFRNWQGGMEHGAEDWADAYDVAKRRANPDDTKNRILSANVRVDTQGDRRLSNNNMIVIGSSGTYKTTSVVTPNLLQANENYIILDVKGELLYKYGLFLKSRGYTIRVLNLKEQDKSDAYNPFDYIENELDLIKLIANIQAACNPPDAVTSDSFWKEGASLTLLSEETGSPKSPNLSGRKYTENLVAGAGARDSVAHGGHGLQGPRRGAADPALGRRCGEAELPLRRPDCRRPRGGGVSSSGWTSSTPARGRRTRKRSWA